MRSKGRSSSRGRRGSGTEIQGSEICANLCSKMKLIDKFVSRELLVNVLFAIAVLSLVLVVGNIFRKLLPLLVNIDVPMEYLLAFIDYVFLFFINLLIT